MITEARHPEVHTAWAPWSEEQTLHVACVYFNPFRYRNRRMRFHEFYDYMSREPNVKLHVVEVAFGQRPFEVTTSSDLQLRTDDEMWLKENALNLAIAQFPSDWRYGAWVDADFRFSRHDWALETIHQLQHYPWVQPFSGYAFLTDQHRPNSISPSFAYVYATHFGSSTDQHRNHFGNNQDSSGSGRSSGVTGGAWAFTRRGFDSVGGLLDFCILGSSDWHMAFGLVGSFYSRHSETTGLVNTPYMTMIESWKERAFGAVKGNIGYVDNLGTHLWHGDMSNRGYSTRWKILNEFKYNPLTDLARNSQGLYRWAGNKPQLAIAVRRYFVSRNEDSTEVHTPPLY